MHDHVLESLGYSCDFSVEKDLFTKLYPPFYPPLSVISFRLDIAISLKNFKS